MIKKFKTYILHESIDSKKEVITVKKSIEDIFDELNDHDDVFDYLKKELIGKNVEFYAEKPNVRDVKRYRGVVEDIVSRNGFHFIVKGDDHWVFDSNPMKWKKTINRIITDEDPYGEEEWK